MQTAPVPSTLDATRVLAVPVIELSERDRPLLRPHFLELNDDDRYLRFGTVLPDAVIKKYVDGIDFSRDAVFGVYDDQLRLAAVGHFAPLRDTAPPSAEFGVSVSKPARGRGLGTALCLRAATHARNHNIRVLFMHCLSQNIAMMRIARKAGMAIHHADGESDAHLELAPADASSLTQEAVQQQIALFDFALKSQARFHQLALKLFPATA